MSERAKDELEIFTGNSNPALAREVCEYLGVKLCQVEVGRFPDGEVMIEVRENVRGGDCFVIQSTCTPPNENLMELLLLMDALRRASKEVCDLLKVHPSTVYKLTREGKIPGFRIGSEWRF